MLKTNEFTKKHKQLIDAFPETITSGSMEAFIRQLMKILGCDGGLHAQVESISDTKIEIPVSTLVGLPENYVDIYKKAHAMNHDIGDPLLEAPFRRGFYRAYGAHDIAPDLNETEYYEHFLFMQNMDDACTFAAPDVDGKTYHFFSIFLSRPLDQKSPSQRKETNRAFTSHHIQVFEDLMYSACFFHGKSLNENNHNTPQIARPPEKDSTPQELLTVDEKLELIDHAVQVEAENQPENPALKQLSTYIRGITKGVITQSYESYVDNQQEKEITEEVLRKRCPELTKWPEGRQPIDTVRKDGRPGSRKENAKEFVERSLNEADIVEQVYLTDIRAINKALGRALDNLADKTGVVATNWYPSRKLINRSK